jgi:hypothetical protein
VTDRNLGNCPYCRSDELVRLPGRYSDGDNRSGVQVTAFRSISFARIICLQCGSVREWVDSQEDLEMLRNKFR